MTKDELFNSHFSMIADTPVITKESFEKVLTELREQYYYHIENSSGTKEADYIDKMVWKEEIK